MRQGLGFPALARKGHALVFDGIAWALSFALVRNGDLTATRIPVATGPATLGDSNIQASVTGNVLAISGTLTALRTWTIPDRSLILRGISGTQTNGRISKFDANGDQTDSLIADAVAGSALTIGGTLTAPRTHTAQDIAGTIPLIEVQPCASFQNKLINPRFDIWQRGTTFTPTLNTETYDSDRFFTKIDGTSVVFTVTQQAHTLGTLADEPTYFRRCAITTAGTSSTITKILAQRIEGVRIFAGKRVIIAFKAKADAARTITPNYVQSFGTGGAPSANVTGAGTGIALTTSWATYTQVITLPSISGKTMGTTIGTDYLELWFSAAANTVQTIDISDIEIKEVAASGQVNSPFEIRPLAAELAMCQRYLPVIKGGSVTTYTCTGYCSSATQAAYFFPLRSSPRVPPTGAIFAAAANYAVNDGVSGTACVSLSFLSSGDGVAVILANVASGLTANRPVTLEIAANTNIIFTGCEL